MKIYKKSQIKVHYTIGLIALLSIILIVPTSCKKYLDAKPNKSVVVPSTLKDLQAILDNIDVMNRVYPYDGELACDDYYMTYTDWSSQYLQEDKDNYIWKKDAKVIDADWANLYKIVYYADLILETLDNIPVNSGNQTQWNSTKGSALFYRAYAFYELTQLFTEPYNPNNTSDPLGIPIKLTSDIYSKTQRATVNDTYVQIIADLKNSIPLLPVNVSYTSRPGKGAAYGELARTYLAMSNYPKSGAYADSCLQLNSKLINYNTIDPASYNPFSSFNDETTFYSIMLGSSAILAPVGKVDTALYAQYENNDLRKAIFFLDNGDGTYSFKGGYDTYGSMFNGIATDEMYLVRAEANARSAKNDNALADLNTLLKYRYKTGTFIPLTTANLTDILSKILNERRKELIFRGLRWGDLRRLNSDSKFAVTLTRSLNGQVYKLPLNDPRYAFAIPDKVIQQTGIQQNVR